MATREQIYDIVANNVEDGRWVDEQALVEDIFDDISLEYGVIYDIRVEDDVLSILEDHLDLTTDEQTDAITDLIYSSIET